MSEGEAKALVSKCDKDGSKGIDFAEFALLWEALHGEAEVINKYKYFSSAYLINEKCSEKSESTRKIAWEPLKKVWKNLRA